MPEGGCDGKEKEARKEKTVSRKGEWKEMLEEKV